MTRCAPAFFEPERNPMVPPERMGFARLRLSYVSRATGHRVTARAANPRSGGGRSPCAARASCRSSFPRRALRSLVGAQCGYGYRGHSYSVALPAQRQLNVLRYNTRAATTPGRRVGPAAAGATLMPIDQPTDLLGWDRSLTDRQEPVLKDSRMIIRRHDRAKDVVLDDRRIEDSLAQPSSSSPSTCEMAN
jgi:hypothetical protein